MRATRLLLAISTFFLGSFAQANQSNVVNIYAWAQEIPSSVITQFEKETGIHVNHTAYDSNEVMYAKLRTGKNPGYDIVEPSSYYVERMRHLGMLEKLDRDALPNLRHLNPWFNHQHYDPDNLYNVPFLWGATGIFINNSHFASEKITQWSDLLKSNFKNQLMILDDPREAFSMALLMLGYSINDKNPAHIKQAWLKLKELMPNIRLFNTDAVKSILIDEDAVIGIAWNGDLASAFAENHKLAFIYPKDGFEIWVDSFVILKDAPHRNNAYRLLNFLLRPDIAREISMHTGYATANLTAKNSLPPELKNNPLLYPSAEVLKHGEFETDIGDDTFALYEKYWEKLKMGA